MKISPLGAVIAADILDVDLAKPLDDQTIALIGDAWNDQLVLRFRNQRLNDDDLYHQDCHS